MVIMRVLGIGQDPMEWVNCILKMGLISKAFSRTVKLLGKVFSYILMDHINEVILLMVNLMDMVSLYQEQVISHIEEIGLEMFQMERASKHILMDQVIEVDL